MPVSEKTLHKLRTFLAQVNAAYKPAGGISKIQDFFLEKRTAQEDSLLGLAAWCVEYFCCNSGSFTNNWWPVQAVILFLEDQKRVSWDETTLTNFKRCLEATFQSRCCAYQPILSCLESYFRS